MNPGQPGALSLSTVAILTRDAESEISGFGRAVGLQDFAPQWRPADGTLSGASRAPGQDSPVALKGNAWGSFPASAGVVAMIPLPPGRHMPQPVSALGRRRGLYLPAIQVSDAAANLSGSGRAARPVKSRTPIDRCRAASTRRGERGSAQVKMDPDFQLATNLAPPASRPVRARFPTMPSRDEILFISGASAQ
jgi:hypothetical protein